MPPIKKSEMEEFQNQIDDLVWEHDISYIDAIVMFCETHNLEMERVSKIISPVLLKRVREEAETLSMIKVRKTPRLPLK